MKVDSVAIDTLLLDPSNARRHAAKNLEAIKGSLAKFGQQKPIVVTPKGVVLAGNGTLEAARALGWDKIAVVRTKLDGTDATAYAIADNRTGELAEWDAGALSETLKSLQEMEFDLGAIGFDEADFVYCDPPYGMHLDAAAFKKEGAGPGIYKGHQAKHRDVIGDHDDFTPKLINTVFASFPGCAEVFLWGADYYAEHIPDRKAGSWIVWDKVTRADGEVSGVSKFHGSNFELCWSKAKHQRDLARVMHKGLASIENDKRVHPTQKPVALAQWFFERWGKAGDSVVDLFLGSGSTLIACEKTGRRCFGMEIDPRYCDVIVARWEQFTGKTSSLMSEVS